MMESLYRNAREKPPFPSEVKATPDVAFATGRLFDFGFAFFADSQGIASHRSGNDRGATFRRQNGQIQKLSFSARQRNCM